MYPLKWIILTVHNLVELSNIIIIIVIKMHLKIILHNAQYFIKIHNIWYILIVGTYNIIYYIDKIIIIIIITILYLNL